MDELITALRKIDTEHLIYWCSEKSIEMMKQNKPMIGIDCPVFSAWDILDIEYLSVVHSNDHRNSKKPPLLGTIVSLDRRVANHTIPEGMQVDSGSDIFKALLGMTAEQFQYQNLYWIYEKINRDWHSIIFSFFCNPNGR